MKYIHCITSQARNQSFYFAQLYSMVYTVYSNNLDDVNTEYLIEVHWQTGKKCIDSPAAGEMTNRNTQNCWRCEYCFPRSW